MHNPIENFYLIGSVLAAVILLVDTKCNLRVLASENYADDDCKWILDSCQTPPAEAGRTLSFVDFTIDWRLSSNFQSYNFSATHHQSIICIQSGFVFQVGFKVCAAIRVMLYVWIRVVSQNCGSPDTSSDVYALQFFHEMLSDGQVIATAVICRLRLSVDSTHSIFSAAVSCTTDGSH